MSASLIRNATKLTLNALRSNGLRSISSKASMINMNVKLNTGLVAPIFNANQLTALNKRFYSSDVKFSPEQIEAKVLEVLKNFDRIKENPAKPEVTIESHLTKDLGLDSLDHVEIIVQLEDIFGYEIPDSDYEKLYTPKEMVKYVQKRIAEI